MLKINSIVLVVFISFLVLFLPFQFYIVSEPKLVISSLVTIETALIFMCIPIILYFKYYNHKYESPLVPFFCVYFIISYILPFGFFDQEIFNSYIKLCMDDRMIVPTGIPPNEAEICSFKSEQFINNLVSKLLFISIAFIAGYFLSTKIFSSINTNIYFFEVDKNLKIELLICFLFILILVKKFIFIQYIPILSQSIIPLSYIVSGLSIYIYTSKRKNLKFIFLIPIIIFIIKDIIDGYISYPVLLSFFSLTLYCIFKKKFPLLFIIILFLLANLAHFFKYEHRSNLNVLQNVSNSEKILIYKDTVDTIISKYNFKNEFQNNLQRIGHPLHSFSIINKQSPINVPFWNGYSYKIFTTKFIPRFLWKDKPSDKIGNKVGKRYKVLNEYDEATSWNLPIINEFYVNFGIFGLIIGSFLLSVFMVFISKIFKSSNNTPIMTIISIYVTFKLFFLESHLSMVFGNLIQNLILITIPFLLINFKKFKNVKSIINNK